MIAALVLATARSSIADFVSAVILVYTLLIFAYIVMQWFLGFGGRVPYSSASSAVMGFLRDTVEPYLRIFRRFIPPIGPLDISPIVAILALNFGGRIIVNLIQG